MSTALVKRDEKGHWQKGTPSPNPQGQHPTTTARLWRNLLRESVGTMADGSPYTRAAELFDVAFQRAMDGERKDAVLWAKLILERAEGPAREDVADALGFAAIAARECARYLQRDGDEPAPAAAEPEASEE